MPGPPDPEAIDDAEEVSQRVSRGETGVPDINGPRPKDMGKVSVIRGRVSPEHAYYLVRKGSEPDEDDGVRYTSAGDLRDAGFVVTHTPNNRNVDHVSVTYPGDWDEDVQRLFQNCFSERVWYREESDEGE